jgi:hypothetical protein
MSATKRIRGHRAIADPLLPRSHALPPGTIRTCPPPRIVPLPRMNLDLDLPRIYNRLAHLYRNYVLNPKICVRFLRVLLI